MANPARMIAAAIKAPHVVVLRMLSLFFFPLYRLASISTASYT
jgi:hypothetical protein